MTKDEIHAQIQAMSLEAIKSGYLVSQEELRSAKIASRNRYIATAIILYCSHVLSTNTVADNTYYNKRLLMGPYRALVSMLRDTKYWSTEIAREKLRQYYEAVLSYNDSEIISPRLMSHDALLDTSDNWDISTTDLSPVIKSAILALNVEEIHEHTDISVVSNMMFSIQSNYQKDVKNKALSSNGYRSAQNKFTLASLQRNTLVSEILDENFSLLHQSLRVSISMDPVLVNTLLEASQTIQGQAMIVHLLSHCLHLNLSMDFDVDALVSIVDDPAHSLMPMPLLYSITSIME